MVLVFTVAHFGATHWGRPCAIGFGRRNGTLVFFFVGWPAGLVRRTKCLVKFAAAGVRLRALCAMSCSHITAWEVVTADRDDPDSLLNAHPRFIRRLSWFDITLGMLAVVAAVALSQAAEQHAMAAVGISALGMAWLHDRCDRFSAGFLRAMADFGLYSPLLFFRTLSIQLGL
ncbi:MAG: hypothetical protein Ct9H300mP32_0450 [Verrucomicrobiota bacterium]|nr:MAG: hypothetical protein Ct9H300mP32_0450 [Verrucomicrobiota bacterium]